MTEFRKELGTRIKILRKELGFSLKELSERIDLSVSFLSDIENGRSTPSLERIREIATGLNTSVSFLLGESIISELTADNKDLLLKQIVNELHDFNSWTDSDKKELLSYLKAKRMIRNSSKH